MRVPDVIVKFSLKENKEEEEWVAKSPVLPNCAYACPSVPDLLRIIEEELYKEFKDATYIDGGIISMTAEFSIFRQRERTLDAFIAPEPKAEPVQEENHV